MTVAKRVYPRIDADRVPDLEHWVSLPEAGVMLDLSRQRAYGWAAEGRFKTLRKVRSGPEKRALFVVKRTEVERLAVAKQRSAAAHSTDT